MVKAYGDFYRIETVINTSQAGRSGICVKKVIIIKGHLAVV